MTQYFKKFPVTNYANTAAINLMSRVTMSKLALRNQQSFYDYVMKDDERVDGTSYNYYDNPDYVWLINLTNNIIDPYYDLPLTDDNLNKMITVKYGSVLTAQRTILFYRNNWTNDESNITTAAYAALGLGQQKYWQPELGYNNSIIGYVRKQEDWVVTTNMLKGLEISSLTGAFISDELLQIGGNTVATVSYSSDEYVVAKHIFGTISASNTIVGLTSGATATVSTATSIAQNIADNELVYWSPISAYEYEHELNHQKKSIKLLDNKYSSEATKQLKNLLR
jgi:hypothetical protein